MMLFVNPPRNLYLYRPALVGTLATMLLGGPAIASADDSPDDVVTDAVDPAPAPLREGECGEWSQPDDDEIEIELDIDPDIDAQAYCLARCKGLSSYYYVSQDPVTIGDEGEAACYRAGKTFCEQNFDRRLRDSCLGQ